MPVSESLHFATAAEGKGAWYGGKMDGTDLRRSGAVWDMDSIYVGAAPYVMG